MNNDLRIALGLGILLICIILSVAALIYIAASREDKSDFIKFQPSELSINDDSLWDLSPGATIEIQATVEFSITNGVEAITMTGPLTLTVQ